MTKRRAYSGGRIGALSGGSREGPGPQESGLIWNGMVGMEVS